MISQTPSWRRGQRLSKKTMLNKMNLEMLPKTHWQSLPPDMEQAPNHACSWSYSQLRMEQRQIRTQTASSWLSRAVHHTAASTLLDSVQPNMLNTPPSFSQSRKAMEIKMQVRPLRCQMGQTRQHAATPRTVDWKPWHGDKALPECSSKHDQAAPPGRMAIKESPRHTPPIRPRRQPITKWPALSQHKGPEPRHERPSCCVQPEQETPQQLSQ